MAVNTKNYYLKKPSPEDFYNVEDQNGNMDIIDHELKSLNENKAGVEHNHNGLYETPNDVQSKVDAAKVSANQYTDQKFTTLNSGLSSYLSDYVRQPGYAITTGSANAYAATLNPVPVLVDGIGVVIKIHAANTGASTLNLNGLGAKPIIDSKGYQVKAGKLLYGRIYSLKYDGANFQLQGEGGEIPKLPNLVKNGSFEVNDNSWNFGGNGVSYPSSTGIFGSKTVYMISTAGDTIQHVNQNINYIPSGHKIYMSAHVYIGAYTGGEPPKIGLSTINILDGAYGVVYTDQAKLSQWQFISIIGINTQSGVNIGLYELGYDGTMCNFDGIMMIDLTEAYGAGNEPTKAEMDAVVQNNGGWWDSDLPLLTADATATIWDGLQGKVYYSGGNRLVGEIPVKTPDILDHVNAINTSVGAHSGDGQNCAYLQFTDIDKFFQGARWVRSIQPDLLPQNIVNGKNILGVTGTNQNKRWASGTSAPSTDTLLFSYVQGGDAGFYYTSVTGLTFKPTSIIVKFLSISGSQMFYVLYDEGTENSMYPKSVKMFFVSSSTLTTNSYHVKGDTGAATVTNTGFLLPMPAGWNNMSGRPWAWIAYE